MPYEPLESKRVFQRAEAVADQVWELVLPWDWFARKVVGVQLTRAADSIGANIAEAAGRFHPNDVRNYFYYARGSLQETKYWLRRGHRRNLIDGAVLAQLTNELEQLAREINQCITFQKSRAAPKPLNHPTTQPPNHLTT